MLKNEVLKEVVDTAGNKISGSIWKAENGEDKGLFFIQFAGASFASSVLVVKDFFREKRGFSFKGEYIDFLRSANSHPFYLTFPHESVKVTDDIFDAIINEIIPTVCGY